MIYHFNIMKIGTQVDFVLFNVRGKGVILEYDKKTKMAMVEYNGSRYPNTQTFKTLPKKKKDIPFWYIKK
tara:strand:- start:983 stop:1192 length:210 start_codon:yes stop_codon:yes gene_type:complete